MNKTLSLILLIFFYLSVNAQVAEENFTQYVNPFIGTENMGHTYPGATVPFGMVQLSPETDTIMFFKPDGSYNSDVYKYCAGYQYDDKTITGFSHTHFSGTGHSDLGDFLIMPTVGAVKLNPGTENNPESGYRSRFTHDNESAKPGYYQVYLGDYKINAELSASTRVGFHQYTFPKTDEANIILDLFAGIYNYDGKVVWSSIRFENDTLITGFRQTNGWARNKILYFAMSLSKPIEEYGFIDEDKMPYGGFWRKWNQTQNFPERAGKKIKAWFRFKAKKGEKIKIKFALSAVSTKGAIGNLSEIDGWDFEKTVKNADKFWNTELSKIKIEADRKTKENFYTSLYHSFLGPTVYMDTDKKYRGLDFDIHEADNFTNYTTFSLWDTYRALHPLFTIVQKKRTSDIVNSLLAHYEQSPHKILPIWSHHANDNWCMIGYHGVSVISDAVMKGIRGFNLDLAYEAVVNSAKYKAYDGLKYYMDYKYVPMDKNSSSVSKTLEYAYDDFTIARFSGLMKSAKNEKEFTERALYYKNVYDKISGFMRAKDTKGNWVEKFDPLYTHQRGYIEGNAWNYSLYVPHDVNGFMKLIGGEQKLVNWLDSLFIMQIPDEMFAHTEDIERNGIIGNYIHGNEPSHHVPYMYVYAGEAHKTQEKIHLIMNTMFDNKPDGLPGNDDCGQMSAWYIFSALGFYPVCPGTNEYVFGSPYVKNAEIRLENGNVFKIKADKLSDKNIYIKSILLNGKKYNKTYIRHEDIIKGGKLIFKMSSKPNKNFGKSLQSRPYSLSEYKK